MIVITGGAGFIGSTLAKELSSEELIIIDIYSDNIQKLYLEEISNARLVNISNSKDILEQFKDKITYFYHFGANASTDQNILNQSINLNIYWSQYYWDFCTKNNIPFVYASSAATYGDGSKGFSDEMNFDQLKIYLINGGTLGITTFTRIEMGLKIILLVCTIGYTISRWSINEKNK